MTTQPPALPRYSLLFRLLTWLTAWLDERVAKRWHCPVCDCPLGWPDDVGAAYCRHCKDWWQMLPEPWEV